VGDGRQCICADIRFCSGATEGDEGRQQGHGKQ
jgi:hypothetical protein